MIILDTNIVSEAMASSPAPSVLEWIARQRFADDLFVTTITVAEILYGIELLPKGKRHERLLREAEAMFAEDFARRILPFDEPAARIFGKIAATRRSQGRPIAALDAQLASIVWINGATLATRNTSDFEGCGLRLVNPWND